MMFATGKYLKDKAANARRAATTLRQLAESSESSLADRGVMLAAAAIVESIAAKTARLGKERKASEEKYERDLKAACIESKKLVETLPRTTVLEKVAIAAFEKHRLTYLQTELDSDQNAAQLLRALDYLANDRISDAYRDIASEFVRRKTPIADSFTKFKATVEQRMTDPLVIRLAERYAAILNSTVEPS